MEERRWSNEVMCRDGSWSGGAGWMRSADEWRWCVAERLQ